MPNSIPSIVLFCATFIFFYMNIWFLIALAIKRNDIADIAWGLGFSTLALLVPHNSQLSQDLVIRLLIVIWGVRLSYHIYIRNISKEEDYRYRSWRLSWGKWFLLRSYLQIYMVQGLFMFLIATPIIIASTSQTPPLNWLYWLGIGVWIIGFIFESIGDMQLSEFLKKNKSKNTIMKQGLWKYTRHPNYFGEVAQWWGIFFIVATQTYGYIAFISPITITILILGVSGIPMLEKKYEHNLEFQRYKETTSAFFPWFPNE